MYHYLIFDADHTLIDFNRDERAAFARTFAYFGAPYTDADIQRAWTLSYTVWAEEGLNDVHLESIRRTFHEKYTAHLPRLFRRIQEGFSVPATPEELSARFIEELNAPAAPLGEGLTTFQRLSTQYKTCIATNGLTVMQTARLQAFLPYAHAVFISQEFGTIKPDTAFFTGMLARLGVGAKDCLFIGDSLTTDVVGSQSVGMDCVWFNPSARPLPEGYFPVGQISAIEQLEDWLAHAQKRQ